ncbi:endonuclease III [Candidatus Uhrbacteria bacterium]|nr:endonuclease III [Candidatus Uhrbacteria bacterium]
MPKNNGAPRAQKIYAKLQALFPNAGMILRYSNPWECLVAVMLSAQCTDSQVNKVTAKLFKKYTTLDDYVHAKQREFEKDIFSTGFYRNKAKHILAAAKMVQREFGGSVPGTMEEMLRLPGVGRKTANVVLGNCFGVYEGIAVDTHVMRLSQKLGLTKHTAPHTIEKDLMRLFPQKQWFPLTYLLIEYGRKYCTARKHDHENCPIQ